MGRIDEAVLEGGRGSTKSSFASVELVLLLIRHPEMCIRDRKNDKYSDFNGKVNLRSRTEVHT